MGLKFLLLKINTPGFLFRGMNRAILFVIYASEEARVLRSIEESTGHCKVILTSEIPENSGLAIRRLRRMLRVAGTLVVTSKPIQLPGLSELSCEAHLKGRRVMDLETALLQFNPSIAADPDQLIQMIAQKSVHQNPARLAYRKIKNALEPVLAALLLLLLSPILVLVALAVKLTSLGPVIYGQERVGLQGRRFRIYKFRSMRTDAEKNGPVWASAAKGDSRLTPIGEFLRASHLDEIPQLWNVVRGELSFVGPRPERPVFVDQLTQTIPLFALRAMVKPGITGWAQVRQGYANTIADSERKLEFDLFYILRHSPWLDFLIVANTFGVLFSGGTEGRKRRSAVGAIPVARGRGVIPAGLRRAAVEPVNAAAVAAAVEENVVASL